MKIGEPVSHQSNPIHVLDQAFFLIEECRFDIKCHLTKWLIHYGEEFFTSLSVKRYNSFFVTWFPHKVSVEN